jgi:phosphatidylserine/phosphatidylglycerophosphate/cardiolipin synthase-like enzyme
MRVTAASGNFRVKAIAGIRTVLIAIDCDKADRAGLLGFGFRRQIVGQGATAKWLRSTKVFKSIEPDPKAARDPNDPTKPKRFYTNEHPIQSFLWGDYGADPGTAYKFEVYPMYGAPGALVQRPPITFDIRTENEFDEQHGIWFNRGAIASQKFSEEFQNSAPSHINDENDPEVKWLSRGLLEACLRYINDTPANHGLRVAAYEFTYLPVLNALKSAIERGVDVRIVYHDTTDDGEPGANEDAITTAEVPKTQPNSGRRVLYKRTKTEIPHNKFIVRLDAKGKPVEVWTGSTNFTESGFLGQSNVGHWVKDADTAAAYLAYWDIVRKDPDLDSARAKVLKLTPDPAAVIDQKSIVPVFSPRARANLLRWYADRMEDCAASMMFTAAFGVVKELAPTIAGPRKLLRFVLMEKPATEAQSKVFAKDRNHLILSYGVPLGEQYRFVDGKPVARKKIQDFALVRWFLREEHFRHSGFVFFVHTKFLLIDPLSDDPLVCTGSANFSSNSLLRNDENMLMIRGSTRVADIYLTEFDRIFRHFYFRDVANELANKGSDAKSIFLDESNSNDWSKSYFADDSFKSMRREMFFADPKPRWFENGAARAIGGATLPAAKKKTSKKKVGPAKKSPVGNAKKRT